MLGTNNKVCRRSTLSKLKNVAKNIQKSKGLKRSLVNKELTIEIYEHEHCILDDEDKSQTTSVVP